uniref:C-type lectin domain-containing protein n=1 Tax=Amphiprion percula TaxID=161767 RepID=A0A3P8TBF0_AMPPE
MLPLGKWGRSGSGVAALRFGAPSRENSETPADVADGSLSSKSFSPAPLITPLVYCSPVICQSVFLMTSVSLTGWFILPSCPLHQYYFVKEPLTWDEAQTYCRERFTDLATIDNMTEMNQLTDTVSSTGYNSEVWIGAFSEINWKWSDGSEAEYRHWGRNQPNYFTAGFCVLSTAGGNWGDNLSSFSLFSSL